MMVCPKGGEEAIYISVYGLCVARDSTSEGDRESGSPFGIDCFSSDFRGEWSIGSLSCCACPDIATNQTERRQWLRIYISERIEGVTFCERMIGRRKCGTVEFEIGFSSELSVILFCDPYFMRTNPLEGFTGQTPKPLNRPTKKSDFFKVLRKL
jgi:hypothetical protein